MRMHLMAGIVVSTAMVVAQPRTPIDVALLGPQVGEQVPDFTLRDQNGTARSLQSVMGKPRSDARVRSLRRLVTLLQNHPRALGSAKQPLASGCARIRSTRPDTRNGA
jgi:hypothetical protein